jgi:hypothetical protein
MNAHLAEHEHPADQYSIADIALLPYSTSTSLAQETGLPHLARWKYPLMARESVRRGMPFTKDQGAEADDRRRDAGIRRRASFGAVRRTSIPDEVVARTARISSRPGTVGQAQGLVQPALTMILDAR